MNDDVNTNISFTEHNYFGIFILKFLAILAVFGVISFMSPNITASGYLTMFVGALLVSVLDFVISSFIGIFDMQIGRMLTSFLTAIVIIYGIEFFTSAINVSIMTAIIASLAYSFVSSFIPGKLGE